MDLSFITAHEYQGWLVVAALVLVSALFSAVESALFSLGPIRLGQMEDRGLSTASVIRKLMEVPRRLLATLTLGNETANLAAVILITWLMLGRQSSIVGPDAPLIARLYYGPLLPGMAVSFVVLLFAGQALPKVLGVAAAAPLSLAIAYPLWLFAWLSWPARFVFQGAAELLLKALGQNPDAPMSESFEEDDIKELVDSGSRHGLLDVTERELLVNLLTSGEVTAGDIMTPRHQIISIAAGASEKDARAIIDREDYSRLPVFEGGPDNFVGVVTAKDLLKFRLSGPLSMKDVMREPVFVPESRRMQDLLLDFKRSRSHLALVIDEFGAMSGLITMEDVLEEIFGEIHEEEEETDFIALGDNHWRVMGRVEISDFNGRTGANITGSDTRTIAGLVLSKLGRRPKPGDEVREGALSFKVIEVRGIIIHWLEIRREVGE